MGRCTKTTSKSPSNGSYLGYPQLSPPSEITKVGSDCYISRTVCTDTARCTELWNYTCPPGVTPGEHWTRIILQPVPCPPDIPPPSITSPRTSRGCFGTPNMYSVVIDPNGREILRTLVQANHPDCVSGTPPGGSSCASNPGIPPSSGGGLPYSLNTSGQSSNSSMEYAFGTGQSGGVPCWMRPKETHVPRPGPGFQDLVASVLFPSSLEYLYNIHRSGIESLSAPYFFRDRNTPDWVKDPLATTSAPESATACIPVTFGPVDAYKEVYAYFTISQAVVGDLLVLARLWAKDYYYDCENQIASQWDFLKSYFPLYIDEAVGSRSGYPSADLTTHILPGGVEVILPTYLFSRSQNTFFSTAFGSKQTLGAHLQLCGDFPVIMQGWDYLVKVWSTFSAAIRIPRCLIPEGGTMTYTFNVTFSLPDAMTQPPATWNVIQDRAPVDVCINTPGCTKKNHQIMVYDYPNDFSVFEGLPAVPPQPTPPTAPTVPVNPGVRFVSESTWDVVGGAQIETIVTYIERTGFPRTNYITLSPAQQAVLTSEGISIPTPPIFLWRTSPPSTFTDFDAINWLPEPGYPDPVPLYNLQQLGLMNYYEQCVVLAAAYQQQYSVYVADLADYLDNMTYFNNHTYPAWVAQEKASRDAYTAAAKSIGVVVGKTPQENTKGGICASRPSSN